jgi:oxygen-dependent protoporphyrinogen oxidase
MSGPQVVVIGGGIAGLAAAYRLVAIGEVDVTLVEKDARLGGKILTENVDGFVIEGGPDAFLAWKPRGRALCDELGLEVVGSNEQARRAYVMRDGRLHMLPNGIAGVIPRRFAPTMRSPLLSPRGKLRLAVEWAVPRRRGDGEESLAAFVSRRAGRETWERLVEPLVTGVYAGDGERLAMEATFPMLGEAESEHGSLIRAGLAARRAGRTAPPGPMFMTTTEGLGGLVDALARRVEQAGTLITGAEVLSIGRSGGTWHIGLNGRPDLQADAVVLATPAHESAALLTDVDPALAGELRAVPYVSTATVSLAYAEQAVRRPIDGHGYVLPRTEGSPIVACSIVSTKFPTRSKAGWVFVRAFVGRHGQPDPLARSDADLVDLVAGELARSLGVQGEPALRRVYRWPEAIPQYVLGHRARIARIRDQVAKHPGLAVAGAAYRGIGIPDCITSGDEAADGVLEHVRSQVP